jgi:hypothetical protein
VYETAEDEMADEVADEVAFQALIEIVNLSNCADK